jgi:hypothetical protein
MICASLEGMKAANASSTELDISSGRRGGLYIPEKLYFEGDHVSMMQTLLYTLLGQHS